MLDSLLRKDTQRPGYVPPASPQARMQEALASTPQQKPAAEPPKAEPPRVETRVETSPAPEAAKSGEPVSRLFVGPDIKMKGAEITDCDTLVVEGRVEAAMDSRAIEISEKGVFVGKAGVDIAEIRGRFEGELTVRKLLVVRATGNVSGKIRYGKMSIEENGEISGDIAALSSGAAAGSSTQSSTQSSGQSSIGSVSQPFTQPKGSGAR